MIVNVLSNFPPGTGETVEVGVCYHRHSLIDGIKPIQLGLVEELSSQRFNGDKIGRDVGVAEVDCHHEEDNEDCLSLGPASQLEVGQCGEPVVLGGYDGPGHGTSIAQGGLRDCEDTGGAGRQDGEAGQTEGGVRSAQASRTEDVTRSGLTSCVHDDVLLLPRTL